VEPAITGILKQWFGFTQANSPELLPAIERAVDQVEPLLKQAGNYPGAYRKPVLNALEYTYNMAYSVPGPVSVNLDTYATDDYVHAIFPSVDLVTAAFQTSRAMQDYLVNVPVCDEVYALMGMRRREKTLLGMELTGQVIRQEVPRQVVYFTGHTLESPAPSEKQSRDQIALRFFDSLVNQVSKRITLRKQEMHGLSQEKDLLIARLHASNAQTRPALEKALSEIVSTMQAKARQLDLHHYPDDFAAVLLNPAEHLRLSQYPLSLDSMGIRQENDAANGTKPILFNELIGFDRRDWTVSLVYCSNIQRESFASRLDSAYRSLLI
jgi:hypothetical protein